MMMACGLLVPQIHSRSAKAFAPKTVHVWLVIGLVMWTLVTAIATGRRFAISALTNIGHHTKMASATTPLQGKLVVLCHQLRLRRHPHRLHSVASLAKTTRIATIQRALGAVQCMAIRLALDRQTLLIAVLCQNRTLHPNCSSHHGATA